MDINRLCRNITTSGVWSRSVGFVVDGRFSVVRMYQGSRNFKVSNAAQSHTDMNTLEHLCAAVSYWLHISPDSRAQITPVNPHSAPIVSLQRLPTMYGNPLSMANECVAS